MNRYVKLTDEENKKILNALDIVKKNESTPKKIAQSCVIPVIISVFLQVWNVIHPAKEDVMNLDIIFMWIWLIISLLLVTLKGIKCQRAFNLLEALTPFCTDDVVCNEISCPFLNESGKCELGVEDGTSR